MFGIARRKNHSQLVRKELGESLDHFVQAATHAARGAGATVGPKVGAARGRVSPTAGKMRSAATDSWGSTVAALAPLAATAANSARQAGNATRKAKAENARAERNIKAAKKATKAMKKQKQSSGNSSKFAKLLMAGAAVGAAGALIMRRRKQQQQWDQYDPSRPMATDTGSGMGTEPVLPASLAPDYSTESTRMTSGSTMGSATTMGGSHSTGSSGMGGSSSGMGGSGSTTGSSPLVTDAVGDQTSSPMHNPTVARMAGGTSPDRVTE